tara:strand:+ start:1332 stop:1529 length:198 start_codon:yes stop_codon:yes gene_type:complete
MKIENFNSIVDKMINYENGSMDEGEVVDFFQELLDRRLISSLQGSYQRHAAILLEKGYIDLRETK